MNSVKINIKINCNHFISNLTEKNGNFRSERIQELINIYKYNVHMDCLEKKAKRMEQDRVQPEDPTVKQAMDRQIRR